MKNIVKYRINDSQARDECPCHRPRALGEVCRAVSYRGCAYVLESPSRLSAGSCRAQVGRVPLADPSAQLIGQNGRLMAPLPVGGDLNSTAIPLESGQ